MKIDITKVTDLVIEGIDHTDHPKYCDAYIAEAHYFGRPMTEEELDVLNEKYSRFTYEHIQDVAPRGDDTALETTDEEKMYMRRDESLNKLF